MHEAGPWTGSSACTKHIGVTHLPMIMFTEEGKDTVTLLLFHLLNIWECSVLPVGNVFFFLPRRRFGDDLRVFQGRKRIAEQRVVGGRGAFKVQTLWMWESAN